MALHETFSSRVTPLPHFNAVPFEHPPTLHSPKPCAVRPPCPVDIVTVTGILSSTSRNSWESASRLPLMPVPVRIGFRHELIETPVASGQVCGPGRFRRRRGWRLRSRRRGRLPRSGWFRCRPARAGLPTARGPMTVPGSGGRWIVGRGGQGISAFIEQ